MLQNEACLCKRTQRRVDLGGGTIALLWKITSLTTRIFAGHLCCRHASPSCISISGLPAAPRYENIWSVGFDQCPCETLFLCLNVAKIMPLGGLCMKKVFLYLNGARDFTKTCRYTSSIHYSLIIWVGFDLKNPMFLPPKVSVHRTTDLGK